MVRRPVCIALLFFMLFFFAPFSLFAGGTAEYKEPDILNKEWVLCVTEFDVSALPVSQQTVGSVLARHIVSLIGVVTERRRTKEEYAYYENLARTELQSSTVQALSKKRNERDQLVFRGDPAWKYKKNLRAIDKEIAALEKTLAEADAAPLSIEAQPLFKLSQDNAKGIFPSRPRAGGEARFCADTKSDALLIGSVSTFHGRLYCTLSVWTLYSSSYQYETALVFSLEETEQAVDDLSSDLIAMLSGTPSAHLAISVEPDTALISLDGVVAGQGTLDEHSYRAGTVSIDLSAQDYESQRMSVATNPDELLKLSVSLKPITYELFNIEPATKAAVYSGSRYLGQSPLEVTVQTDRYEYFHLENDKGEVAKTVLPSFAAANPVVSFDFKTPIESPGAVAEQNRKSFYNAFGRFWIALPVAFIMSGVADAQSKANARSANMDLYNQAAITYYISMGTWIVFGLTAADVLYRSYRYLSNTHAQSVSIIKQ